MNLIDMIANMCIKLGVIIFILVMSCALWYGFSTVYGTIAMVLIGGVIIIATLSLIIRVCCYKKQNNNTSNLTNSDAFYCTAGKIIAKNVTERKSK